MRTLWTMLGGLLLLAACGMGTFETTPINIVYSGEWTFINAGPCTWWELWYRTGDAEPWKLLSRSEDGFGPGEQNTLYCEQHYDWRWGVTYTLRFRGECPESEGLVERSVSFTVPHETYYVDIRLGDAWDPVEVTFH